MRRATLLCAVLALSGCVVAPPIAPPSPSGSVDDVPAFLALDHDHEDAALHEGAKGLALAAYLPVCQKEAPCSFGELDVMGDLAILAITEPDGGFALIDVSDPREPILRSRTDLGRTFATDVKLAPDGKTAFVAVSNWLPFVGKGGASADPTSALGVPRSQGIHVFDVADPSKPAARWFEPVGVEGVHMLDVHVIAGEMYVFATTPAYFKFVVPAQPRSAVEPVWIGRYDPASARIEHIADYVPPEADARQGGGDSAHDITIVDDPVEGPLLLAAFGYGVSIASVSHPASPKHLGTWSLSRDGFDATVRNTHTVMLEYVAGARTLIVTPEQAESNELYVVDARDLAAMKLLGTWHLPGELSEYNGVIWSLHNVNVLNGTAYVAHYHGGVWALDVSTNASLRAPTVLGYYATRETGQVGPGLPEVWAGPTAPNAWDVIPGRGVVFVSDITSGLYVLAADWPIPDALPYGARGADAPSSS